VFLIPPRVWYPPPWGGGGGPVPFGGPVCCPSWGGARGVGRRLPRKGALMGGCLCVLGGVSCVLCGPQLPAGGVPGFVVGAAGGLSRWGACRISVRGGAGSCRARGCCVGCAPAVLGQNVGWGCRGFWFGWGDVGSVGAFFSAGGPLSFVTKPPLLTHKSPPQQKKTNTLKNKPKCHATPPTTPSPTHNKSHQPPLLGFVPPGCCGLPLGSPRRWVPGRGVYLFSIWGGLLD